MVRKIVALAGAGALLLGVAVPAFAHWPYPFQQPFIGNDNVAIVTNSAVAVADTGGNSQSNVADVKCGGGVSVSGSGNRYMNTGDADAYAGALVVANTHVGCDGCGNGHDDDMAFVGNEALAGAYTGDNGQDNYAKVRFGGGVSVSGTGDRTMYTGDANDTARAWVIVNTHWGD